MVEALTWFVVGCGLGEHQSLVTRDVHSVQLLITFQKQFFENPINCRASKRAYSELKLLLLTIKIPKSKQNVN